MLHRPVAIIEHGLPVIAFTTGGAAEEGVAKTADALADKGARVFAVSDWVRKATRLPHVRTDHWLTDRIAAVLSLSCMVEGPAAWRGIDPDTPRHLNKVTKTA